LQAISEEMKSIHAITMKCKTVKQWEDAKASGQ
jgi:acid stress-induced BolA-like protein IbaG/YrbA